jgi:hypothetical protein
MTDDPRVQRLLDELLDPHATPKTFARRAPSCCPVGRNRWQQMHRVRGARPRQERCARQLGRCGASGSPGTAGGLCPWRG